jgi:Fe-Mn family superoxide dismutase
MNFTWSVAERPYSDEEAKETLSGVMSENSTNWHYNKHHKGYAAALNKIDEELKNTNKEGTNGNYSAFAELKRRQPFNHAGVVLHNIFWENLGGNGDTTRAPNILRKIEEDFGSFETWKEDMIATAMSAKLGGWTVLTHDKILSGKLLNVLVDEHQNGALWGGIPLIALDMFEHAYYHKDGPNRMEFITRFFENLHWERIEKLFAS